MSADDAAPIGAKTDLACCFCGARDVWLWPDGKTVRCGGCRAVYGLDKLVPTEPASLRAARPRRALPPGVTCTERAASEDYRHAASGSSLALDLPKRFLDAGGRSLRLGVAASLLAGLITAVAGFGPTAAVLLSVGALLVTLAALARVGPCRVRVADGALRVRVGPLRRAVRVPVGALEQLFCEEERWAARPDRQRYRLVARLRSGRRVTLLRGLRSLDVALALEDRLEDFLGIPDEPVPGEVARAYVSDPSPASRIAAPSTPGAPGAEAEAEREAAAAEEEEAAAARDAARPR